MGKPGWSCRLRSEVNMLILMKLLGRQADRKYDLTNYG